MFISASLDFNLIFRMFKKRIVCFIQLKKTECRVNARSVYWLFWLAEVKKKKKIKLSSICPFVLTSTLAFITFWFYFFNFYISILSFCILYLVSLIKKKKKIFFYSKKIMLGIHTCGHTHIRIWVQTHTHIWEQTHTNTYTYEHKYTHMSTSTYT